MATLIIKTKPVKQAQGQGAYKRVKQLKLTPSNLFRPFGVCWVEEVVILEF